MQKRELGKARAAEQWRRIVRTHSDRGWMFPILRGIETWENARRRRAAKSRGIETYDPWVFPTIVIGRSQSGAGFAGYYTNTITLQLNGKTEVSDWRKILLIHECTHLIAKPDRQTGKKQNHHGKKFLKVAIALYKKFDLLEAVATSNGGYRVERRAAQKAAGLPPNPGTVVMVGVGAKAKAHKEAIIAEWEEHDIKVRYYYRGEAHVVIERDGKNWYATYRVAEYKSGQCPVHYQQWGSTKTINWKSSGGTVRTEVRVCDH